MSVAIATPADPVLARLEAIDRKLDYVVARQRMVEELIEELTPIAREALAVGGGHLSELESRGYFAVGRELATLLDRVITTYGPDEVSQLSEHIVQIVDTVKNITQPDVLAIANDATDVLHHADEVKPVSLLGAARMTRDEEVQHGLALALEVLRHLGRAHGTPTPKRTPPVPAPKAATRQPTAPACAPTAAPAAPPADQVVEWEGRRFDSRGFLLDIDTWDEPLAEKMAAGLGITLTDEHWSVVRWARAEYLATGASPNVRRIAVGSCVGTRRMYEIFPRTPGKTTALIAGIPKPAGCV